MQSARRLAQPRVWHRQKSHAGPLRQPSAARVLFSAPPRHASRKPPWQGPPVKRTTKAPRRLARRDPASPSSAEYRWLSRSPYIDVFHESALRPGHRVVNQPVLWVHLEYASQCDRASGGHRVVCTSVNEGAKRQASLFARLRTSPARWTREAWIGPPIPRGSAPFFRCQRRSGGGWQMRPRSR